MHSRLIEWSRYAFLAGIVLALVLVVPTAWFPFQITKVAAFSIAAFLALFLFALGGGSRDMFRAHGLRLALLAGLIPAWYAVSAYLAGNPASAFIGQGLEIDTVFFSVLGFLSFLLAFLLFRTLRTAKMLTGAVLWTLVAAALFQAALILFGSGIVPFDIFSNPSVNLIGKWNDLGLLAGLALMFLLVREELAPAASMVRRGAAVAFAALLVFLLAVINFSLVWAILLASCIALAIIKFLTQKSEERSSPETESARGFAERTPWWSLGGVVIAVVFLFAGPSINAGLNTVFPVSSLEVRPSYSSTMEIIDASRESSISKTLIGSGPNSFERLWLSHKPAEVNQSAFWNLDFNVGFSILATTLGTIGLVGAALWLIPLFLVLAGLVRAVRLKVLSRDEKVTAVAVGLASIFLFAAIVFYVPSQNIALLALIFSGAAFGFLWRQGRNRAEEDEELSRVRRAGMLLAIPLLLVVCLWTGFISTRHLIAQAIIGKGLAALQSGDADAALAQAARASGIEKNNTDALSLKISANMNKLQALASAEVSEANTADIQAQFTALAQEAIAAGQQLIALNASDYRSHMLLGQMYEFFATLKVTGAYEQARQAYLAAAERNPLNPQIPLMIARLEAAQGNLQGVQTYLGQSLTLKPNYTDAILFLVQLNVSQNDLPSAIQAAQAAAQSAPGVASIWFELGLLYYSAGDTAQAIPALEQAVGLVPEYANAKYFLGLSYYGQKRTDDAIRQFEDLSRTNPDSAEVQLILGNLRAGKPPFDAAVPPADVPPEDRATAPIAE